MNAMVKPADIRLGGRTVPTRTGSTSNVSRFATLAGNKLKKKKGPSADSIARDVARREEARYQSLYRPLNKELIEDIDSTRIIDAAKENATLANARTDEQARRNLARYGVEQDAQTLKETQRMKTLNDAKFYDNAVNSARVEQYERNTNLRNEMINIGRGISRSGQDGIADAANNEVNRENANRMGKANAKASRDQFYGQMAGTALMAAMVFM